MGIEFRTVLILTVSSTIVGLISIAITTNLFPQWSIHINAVIAALCAGLAVNFLLPMIRSKNTQN